MKRTLFILIITIILAVIAAYILYESACIFSNKGCIYSNLSGNVYSGIAGNILIAILTLFLLFVAWEQLGGINNTSSADFIHKLTKDFFTPQARILLGLIECEALEFAEAYDIPDREVTSDGITKSQPYFRVNINKLKKSHFPVDIINSTAIPADPVTAQIH